MSFTEIFYSNKNTLIIFCLIFLCACNKSIPEKTELQEIEVSKSSLPIPEDIKPQLIEDLEGLKFFTNKRFKLWKSYKLSNAYYGPGNHKNYSYDSSSRLGMEAHIKDGSILVSISL